MNGAEGLHRADLHLAASAWVLELMGLGGSLVLGRVRSALGYSRVRLRGALYSCEMVDWVRV